MVRVWTVTSDERLDSLHVFDDLDVALGCIRAEVLANGARKISLESELRPYGEYVSAVEAEDQGVSEAEWQAMDTQEWRGAEL